MKAGIVVPFRDSFHNGERWVEFEVLKHRIWEICDHNKQDYQIFLIIQDDEQPFNKAYLMNVGADLAKDCDYFIFHDVDNIPVGLDNVYKERDRTGPIIGELDGQKLTDIDTQFDGVIYFRKEDYFKINGFSNHYWSWGWEVTPTPLRCAKMNIPVKRHDGGFILMPHETRHRYRGNPNWINNVLICRQVDVKLMDGYTDIKYEISKQYTEGNVNMIYVKIPPPQYEIGKIFTIEEIRNWVGECNEEEYNWILETYSK